MEVRMGTHYHDSDALKRFKDMRELAPAEFKAWLELDRIVGREDGKIPRKYRELIALAVAHTTQCVYCIDAHVKGAKKAGASREEIVETSLLAAHPPARAPPAHRTAPLQ